MASVHVHRDNIESLVAQLKNPPVSFAERILLDQIKRETNSMVSAYENLLFNRKEA